MLAPIATTSVGSIPIAPDWPKYAATPSCTTGSSVLPPARNTTSTSRAFMPAWRSTASQAENERWSSSRHCTSSSWRVIATGSSGAGQSGSTWPSRNSTRSAVASSIFASSHSDSTRS